MRDYVEGKLDWLSAGCPTEGDNAGEPKAGTVARTDVPTCRTDERLGDVAARVRDAGFDACVVVNDRNVVFGLLRADELSQDPDALIEDVMRPGPSTFRPHVPARQMAAYMDKHQLTSSPITRNDGTLVGLLRRGDLREHAPGGEP